MNEKIISGIGEITTVKYRGGIRRPSYKWLVYAICSEGTRIPFDRGQGSWVTAMFRTQDLSKTLGLKNHKTMLRENNYG